MSDVSREIKQAERLRGSGKRKVRGDILAIKSVAKKPFNLDSALNRDSDTNLPRLRNQHRRDVASACRLPPLHEDSEKHRYPLKQPLRKIEPQRNAISADSPLLPLSAREQLTRESHRKSQRKARDPLSPSRLQDHPLKILDLLSAIPLQTIGSELRPTGDTCLEQILPRYYHEEATQSRQARRSIDDFTIQSITSDGVPTLTYPPKSNISDPNNSRAFKSPAIMPLTPSNTAAPSLYNQLMTGTDLRPPIMPHPRVPRRRRRELGEFRIQDDFNGPLTEPEIGSSRLVETRSNHESRSNLSKDVRMTAKNEHRDRTPSRNQGIIEKLPEELKEEPVIFHFSTATDVTAKDGLCHTTVRDLSIDAPATSGDLLRTGLLRSETASLPAKRSDAHDAQSCSKPTKRFKKPTRRESQIHIPLSQSEQPLQPLLKSPPQTNYQEPCHSSSHQGETQQLQQLSRRPAEHSPQNIERRSQAEAAQLSEVHDGMDDFFDMRNHSPLHKSPRTASRVKKRLEAQVLQKSSSIASHDCTGLKELASHPGHQDLTEAVPSAKSGNECHSSHNPSSEVDEQASLLRKPMKKTKDGLKDNGLHAEGKNDVGTAGANGVSTHESFTVSPMVASTAVSRPTAVLSARSCKLSISTESQSPHTLKLKGSSATQRQDAGTLDAYPSPTSDPPSTFHTRRPNDKRSSQDSREYPALLDEEDLSEARNLFDVVRGQANRFDPSGTGDLNGNADFDLDVKRRVSHHLIQLLELHKDVQDVQHQIETTEQATQMWQENTNDLQKADSTVTKKLEEARKHQDEADKKLEKARRRASLLREMSEPPEF